MRRLSIFAAGAAALLFPGNARGEPSVRTVLENAKNSVARITVTRADAAGEASVGTGFVLSGRDRVITAYHLVAGADRVLVRFPNQDAPVRAEVAKVLRNADLALLHLPNESSAAPMRIASVPDPGAQVLSLGHAYGAPSMESLTMLKVREIGGNKLREILNDQNRREIERLGFPDPEIEILNLEGHPAPGFSGSPVLNTNGQVVGVINGGIESGAGSVSWAIPAAELEELLQQPDYRPTREERSRVAEGSHLLFSADLRASSGATLSLEGFKLVKRRTRTLAEMQNTTEDPRGLQQLIYAIGGGGPALTDLAFDIYEDTQSGACVAVPSGFSFEKYEGVLVASSPDRRFGLVVRLDSLGDQDAAMAATRFETYLTWLSPQSAWFNDSSWTYTAAIHRGDGAWVMRKAAYTQPTNAAWKYVFYTLATRGNAALGVAAVNNWWDPRYLEPAAARTWCQMFLSAHLSQYSQ